MRKLVMLLSKSSKKEKRFLYVSYFLDVFFISVMLMLVSVMSNASNLSESDAAQADLMTSSMVIIAIITIVFFLWLISIEFKGLYNSREKFNTNVKLMGFSNKKLMMLYLFEMLYMQTISVVTGCILGEAVYHFFATANLYETVWISPAILLATVIIHLCILLMTVLFIGWRCARHSIISETRGNRRHRRKKWSAILAHAAIAFALICTIELICNGLQKIIDSNDVVIYCQAVRLSYLLVVVFAFDPVMTLIFAIVDFICKKAGAFHFGISLQLSKSFWGRFKAMCFLFIYSGSLFCGLYSLYTTVRTAAKANTEENIHYQSYSIYDKLISSSDDNAHSENQYHTLRYQALLGNDTHIWVTGIDDVYPDTYETFKIDAALADENIDELLNNENFDGILLPDNYVTTENLGDTVSLNVDGKEITFKIYASVLSNDFERLDAYVSKAYLEKQLGITDSYNAVYYMEEPDEIDTTDVFLTQTKEEMVLKNYQESVKSTEVFELVVFMILVCSLLAICTCLIMSCTDNQKALAYMQGLGADKRILAKVFCFQAIWNLVCSIIPVIALTYIISKSLGYLCLNPRYFITGFDMNPIRFVLLFAAYLAVTISVQMFLIKKAAKDETCIELLKN